MTQRYAQRSGRRVWRPLDVARRAAEPSRHCEWTNVGVTAVIRSSGPQGTTGAKNRAQKPAAACSRAVERGSDRLLTFRDRPGAAAVDYEGAYRSKTGRRGAIPWARRTLELKA
jgi:hypothetical protein